MSSTVLSPVIAAATEWTPHVVISGTSMELTQLRLSMGSGASSKVIWFNPAECLQSAEEVRAWVRSAARMEAGLRAAVAGDEALARALAHVVFGRPRFRDWLVDAWREVMGASASGAPTALQWRSLLQHISRQAIFVMARRVRGLWYPRLDVLIRLLRGSVWSCAIRMFAAPCLTCARR